MSALAGLGPVWRALYGLKLRDPRAHAISTLQHQGATPADVQHWLSLYCPNWWAAGRAAAGVHLMISDPADYPPSTARHCLARWLSAWAARDWAAMVETSQLTWTSEQADPAGAVQHWYGAKQLAEATIEHTVPFGDASEDVTVLVTYRLLGQQRPGARRLTVRVIRETAPYEPAPRIGIAGRWGVNPISALREEEARP